MSERLTGAAESNKLGVDVRWSESICPGKFCDSRFNQLLKLVYGDVVKNENMLKTKLAR